MCWAGSKTPSSPVNIRRAAFLWSCSFEQRLCWYLTNTWDLSPLPFSTEKADFRMDFNMDSPRPNQLPARKTSGRLLLSTYVPSLIPFQYNWQTLSLQQVASETTIKGGNEENLQTRISWIKWITSDPWTMWTICSLRSSHWGQGVCCGLAVASDSHWPSL